MTTEEKLETFYTNTLQAASEQAEKALREHSDALDKLYSEHPERKRREEAAELGAGLDELTLRADNLRRALGGCHEEILEAMHALRLVADRLEQRVADADWPLPKYREMLFLY